MAKIFLAYARKDEDRVKKIYNRLVKLEFTPWMDKEDLLPGQDWDREVRLALRSADFILVFLSQNSINKRGYVQKEFRLALDVQKEMPNGLIHTIPVKLDVCNVPEEFSFLHIYDLSGKNGFDKLIRAMRIGLLEQKPTSRETEKSNYTQFMPKKGLKRRSYLGSHLVPLVAVAVLVLSVRLAGDVEFSEFIHHNDSKSVLQDIDRKNKIKKKSKELETNKRQKDIPKHVPPKDDNTPNQQRNLETLAAKKEDLEFRLQVINQYRMQLGQMVGALFSKSINFEKETGEAKAYEKLVKSLQQRDKVYEILARQIETQHRAIVVEIKAVKRVMGQNGDITFGIFATRIKI